jgi:hydrogenase maturation factor
VRTDVAPRCGPHEHCLTCGDDGVAMRVLELDAAGGLALCSEEGGERRSVEVGLVEPVAPGDIVLVHADVALARLSEEAIA